MIINELNEMKNFANNLASQLKEGDVINLIGDMGACNRFYKPVFFYRK